MTQLLGNALSIDLVPGSFVSLDDGTPVATGAHFISTLAGGSIDVWGADPGLIGGVTTDEIFVIIEGRAVITFDDTQETIEVKAGDIVRLFAGQRNTWKTIEQLRKVSFYIPSEQASV